VYRESEDSSHAAAPRRVAPAAIAVVLAMSLGLPMAAQAAEAMRVVRDPVTGELRGPTAAEAAAFEKAEQQLRAQSGKSLTPKAQVDIRYPDGTIETKLGDDSMMYSVVKENGDGSLAMACLPAQQAQAFVKSNGKKATALKAAGKTAKTTGHNHE
jgi:hypothetical protein